MMRKHYLEEFSEEINKTEEVVKPMIEQAQEYQKEDEIEEYGVYFYDLDDDHFAPIPPEINNGSGQYYHEKPANLFRLARRFEFWVDDLVELIKEKNKSVLQTHADLFGKWLATEDGEPDIDKMFRNVIEYYKERDAKEIINLENMIKPYEAK